MLTLKLGGLPVRVMAGRETVGKVEWKEMPCNGKECIYYKNEKCREVMNLQFLLPQVPGLGVWQIDTSSTNSIRNINSSAELIRGIIGRIRMVPLILSLGKQEVINPDDGKKKTVNVMSLRHGATLQNLIADSVKPIQQLLAPPPDDETEPPLDTESPEPDIEQAQKDIDNLFPPDPKHAREAAVKPAPQATESQPAPVAKESNSEPPTGRLDMPWLIESVNALMWDIMKYIKDTYKVDASGNLSDVIDRLSDKQIKELSKEVQDRLDMK